MRYPAVAGQFYEAEPRALGMQIDGCYRHRLGPGEKPAVAKGGPRTHDWEPPLGIARCDRDLAARMMKGPIMDDIIPHRHEHSIEVQLPFLQDLTPDVTFIPICIGIQELEDVVEVGKIVRDAIKGKDVGVLASTDFSHS